MCLHFSGIVKWIRLGELNIADETDTPHVDFSVFEKIPHPSYRPPARYNDIALLKMDRTVEFNVYIRPACLHTTTADIIPHSKYIATGWGLTEVQGEVGSDHLQKVVLEAFSQDQCNASYKNIITTSTRLLRNGIVEESQMCAGSYDVKKDTCQVKFYHIYKYTVYVLKYV